MSEIIGRAVIPVTLDTSGVLRQFRGLEGDVAKTSHRMGTAMKLGIVGAVGGGIGGVVAGVKSVISSASDLNETVSKTNVIFGKHALPAIQKWAAGAADAFGQSKKSA